MQTKLQQLDLFGNPAQDQGGAKEKKKAKAKPLPVAVNIPEPSVIEPVVIETIAAESYDAESSAAEQPVYVERPRQPRITIEKIAGKRGRKSYSEIDTEIDLIEIPDEKVLSQKLYYTISEVASWFKVNTSLLRYWENEFDILKPRKTRKGDRLFRVEDIKNLQIIYFLLRQKNIR